MGLLDSIGAKAVAQAENPHGPGALVHEFRATLNRISDLLGGILAGVTDANEAPRYTRRATQGDCDANGVCQLTLDLPTNLAWEVLSYAGYGTVGGGISLYFDSTDPINLVHADSTSTKFSNELPPEHFVPPQTKVIVLFEGQAPGSHVVFTCIAKANPPTPRIQRGEIYEHDHNAGAF